MKQPANQILGLIDLTSLNDNDTEKTIYELCMKTKTDYGTVPAICIYSSFIPYAKDVLAKYNPMVKIATVTNFPHGSTDFERAIFETELAIKRGADEVDIVFPYHALIAGDYQIGAKMVQAAKKICGQNTLKVIIESGELKESTLIKQASEICISSGADFIKTSTGKVAVNSTLETAEIMLTVIKAAKNKCGFKAAGGIKTVEQAEKYLELTKSIMNADWINSNSFRFGASSLLSDVLLNISGSNQLNEQVTNY